MARVLWPRRQQRPSVRVLLTEAAGGRQVARYLLADTGAGRAQSTFELILDESDCRLCGGSLSHSATLGRAYSGVFPVYILRIQVPELGFDHLLRAVGVPTCPTGFEGIAGFRFLNGFTYGNFGDPGQFGLET